MVRRRQRGDTLVEVVMALAIISTVITSTTILGAASIRLGASSRQRIDAASIMQQEAEMIRNIRDGDIQSEAPGKVGTGWTNFLSTIGGGVPVSFPLCSTNTPIYWTPPIPSVITNGNSWATAVGNPNHYPDPNFLTVTNPQQGKYDTWVEVCSPTAASNTPDDLRFTIQTRWMDATSQNIVQQGSLDTVLANITGINEFALSPMSGTVPIVIPKPHINSFTITGTQDSPTVANHIYSKEQCGGAYGGCERPQASWVASDPSASCTITLGGVTVASGTGVGTNVLLPADNVHTKSSLTYVLTCSDAGGAADNSPLTLPVTVNDCWPYQISGYGPAPYGSYEVLQPPPLTGVNSYSCGAL